MKKIELVYMVYWIYKDDARGVNWGKEQLSSYEKSIDEIYAKLYNGSCTIREQGEAYLDEVSFIKQHILVKKYTVYTNEGN